MARRLMIVATFLFVFFPVVSFAQSGNNCIPWRCEHPPDGCSYCAVVYTNGNATCTSSAIYEGSCFASGFCNTGLGGCTNEIDCMIGADSKDFWIRLAPPRALHDEWQLVDVSVKRRAVHHLRRS